MLTVSTGHSMAIAPIHWTHYCCGYPHRTSREWTCYHFINCGGRAHASLLDYENVQWFLGDGKPFYSVVGHSENIDLQVKLFSHSSIHSKMVKFSILWLSGSYRSYTQPKIYTIVLRPADGMFWCSQ